jgi:hypothetical protein
MIYVCLVDAKKSADKTCFRGTFNHLRSTSSWPDTVRSIQRTLYNRRRVSERSRNPSILHKYSHSCEEILRRQRSMQIGNDRSRMVNRREHFLQFGRLFGYSQAVLTDLGQSMPPKNRFAIKTEQNLCSNSERLELLHS